MIDDETGRKIAVVVFAVALIGCGIWALVQPDLLVDYDPSGRRSVVKGLVKSAWSTTGGVVSIVFGVLSIIGVWVSREETA